MSQSWVRGPVCGVDNCSSRLYRSADGLKICQYGHVMDGNIEINDEQDDNYIQTKRLNINLTGLGGDFSVTPSQILQGGTQNKNKSKKLYGAAAKELYLECLQILLQKQLKIAIKLYFPHAEYDIEGELTPLVKLNWLKLLQSYLVRADEEEAGVSGGNGSFGDINLNDPNMSLPSTIDLICILYLSMASLNLPVYVHTILSSIRQNTIPYMKCFHLIPKPLLDRLPPYYMGLLEPAKLPLENALYENIHVIGKRIQFKDVRFTTNYYFPLVFKIFSKLLLLPNAPELFLFWIQLTETLHLFNEIEDDYTLPDDTLSLRIVEKELRHLSKPKRLWNNRGIPKKVITEFPELKIVSLAILTVKLYFIYGNPIAGDSSSTSPEIIDPYVWIQNVNQYELNHEFPVSQSLDAQENIINWSDMKINRYCQWVYENLIPKKNKTFSIEGSEDISDTMNGELEELSVMDKRLFQIFNIDQQEYLSSGKRKLDLDPQASDNNTEREKDVFYGYNVSSEKAKELTNDDINTIENHMVEKFCIEFGITRMIIEGTNNWLESYVKRTVGSI